MTETTCATCRHFHAVPLDQREKIVQPNGLSVIDLSIVPPGQCREQLRVLTLAGANGVQISAYYPEVPSTWPACGRYVDLDTAMGNGHRLSLTVKSVED